MTPRGLSILVVGPDGAGKSTLARALTERVGAKRKIVLVHHRRPVLPARKRGESGEPVTEPHGEKPYGTWASIGKVIYLFVDVQLDWYLRTRKAVRRGAWLVTERGWWDIGVDLRRYRLSCGRRLSVALGHIAPQPDLVVVLEAPGEEVFARKPELTPDEIDRQVSTWRQTKFREAHVVHLDARLPVDELVERVLAVAASLPRPPNRLVALPSRRNPRWLFPAVPVRAALASLSMYQPMTRQARMAWHVVQAAARVGALRLLPGARPPSWILDRLGDHLPPGGRIAVSASRHSNRMTLLVMSQCGDPVHVVKLAHDETGIARLQREADALRRWGPHLPSPLRSPAVLASEPGLVAVEYLRPIRRAESPWVLPVDVAEALGSTSRRFASRSGYFSHGDVAPWNLFPISNAWALVDWEAATDTAAPFQDVLHYLVQSATLLGRPSTGELVDGFRGRGRIATMLHAFARGAGLDVSDIREAAVRYVHTTIPQLDSYSDDGRLGIAGRRALLTALRVDT